MPDIHEVVRSQRAHRAFATDEVDDTAHRCSSSCGQTFGGRSSARWVGRAAHPLPAPVAGHTFYDRYSSA